MDVMAFMREHQAYFEDFVTRNTYHSNAIEGSTLSYAETYAVLWNDNSMVVKATARELYEAINHKYALQLAMKSGESELSERLIKDVGIAINRNINEIDGYRTVQVVIRGAEHMPPAPEQAIQQMMELVYDYNRDVREGRDVFEREAEFHIRFERIHPFEDGNGRTGRILLNRGIIQAGLPPVVVTKESKAEYLNLIAEHDIEGLAAYFKRLSDAEAQRMQSFADSAE